MAKFLRLKGEQMEPLSLGGQDMSATRMLTEETVDEGSSANPNGGFQSTQHLEIIANPHYEQLVKLIFDGNSTPPRISTMMVVQGE